MRTALVFLSVFASALSLGVDSQHRFGGAKTLSPSPPRPYLNGEFIALGNKVILEKIVISQDEVEDFIASNPNETLIVGDECRGPCEKLPEGQVVPLQERQTVDETELTMFPRKAIQQRRESFQERDVSFLARSNVSQNKEETLEENEPSTTLPQNQPANFLKASTQSVLAKIRTWLSNEEITEKAKRQIASSFEPTSRREAMRMGTLSIAFPAAVTASLLLMLLLSAVNTLRRKRKERLRKVG